MAEYAVVRDGLVENVINWDGDIEQWSPPEDAVVIPFPDGVPVAIGYAYDGKDFSPPAAPVPTPEEALAANQANQSSLLASASQAMTPLLVSLQLGDATDEETASAKLWQAYVRALKLVDLTVSDPAWPAIPA